MALYQELFGENSVLYHNLERLSEVTGNCDNVGQPIKLTNGEVKWRARSLLNNEGLIIRHFTGENRLTEKTLNDPEFQRKIKEVEKRLEDTTKKISEIIQTIESILPELE